MKFYHNRIIGLAAIASQTDSHFIRESGIIYKSTPTVLVVLPVEGDGGARARLEAARVERGARGGGPGGAGGPGRGGPGGRGGGGRRGRGVHVAREGQRREPLLPDDRVHAHLRTLRTERIYC